MRMLLCLLFHDWTRWSTPEMRKYTKHIFMCETDLTGEWPFQRRICQRCGKVKERVV